MENRIMSAIDWTPMFKTYKGKWVALASDEKTVIASAKTAKQVIKLASEKGQKKPILFRVPARNLTYVGHAWGNNIQIQAN